MGNARTFSTLCCLVAILNYHGADAAITVAQVAGTGVTIDTPLPGTANDESTELTLAENTATTITTFTLTGSTGALTWTSSNSAIAVTALSVVSVASGQTLDYEAGTTVTSVLTVVDSTATTALIATVTLTLSLTDVNEAPTFSPTSYTSSVSDGAAAGTVVTTVTATDQDGTSPNNVFAYSISVSSNTNADWSIHTTTGVISVATSKTIAKATTPTYALIVLATDTGTTPLTGTTTVSITAGAAAAMGGILLTGLCGLVSMIGYL